MARPGRSLFRTLAEGLTFLLVLTVVLAAMQRLGMIDLVPTPVTVVDGDSLRTAGGDVRLYGIDAPEYRQSCADASGHDYACGQRAAAYLRSLVGHSGVACRKLEADRYNRAVSVCHIGPMELNTEMVRAGWAVAYARHSLDYVKLEAEARRGRRGIWAGTFEEPEAYRARQRVIQGQMTGAEPEAD
jgi:endonuclease YncB( thermonuclease family)